MNEGAEGVFSGVGGVGWQDWLAKRDSAAFFFYPLDSQIQGWNRVEPLEREADI